MWDSEASPELGAAELAGCEAGWAAGANWAGPHFRAPDPRNASAGSEGVPFAAGAMPLEAVAAGAVLKSAPSSPPFCVPACFMVCQLHVVLRSTKQYVIYMAGGFCIYTSK